jgi:cell fate regulator YaaT (PSP1 superfamily)
MSTAVEDTYVGVRFGEETNLTLCATGGRVIGKDERVVVELESGPAFGTVERSPMPVFKPCQKASARPVLRLAAEEDLEAHRRQVANQWTARRYCQERARELGLEIKVSRVDFQLHGKRATFYFTAEGRVDYRQLVRDLARRFGVRVKMVQVGARDEAGLLGGIGVCGRTLCCSTWLKDFRPISIQMAKRQNLSLNPSKISGQCGRLLCCLAYEDDNYKKRRPKGPSQGALPVVVDE